MKSMHDVLIRPVLSEKSRDGIFDKVYTFEEAKTANKTEIRQAVEAIFGVKVEKVHTIRTIGKMKRQGRYEGRTAEVKKAIVTLRADSKGIEFFDSMR